MEISYSKRIGEVVWVSREKGKSELKTSEKSNMTDRTQPSGIPKQVNSYEGRQKRKIVASCQGPLHQINQKPSE